MSNNFFEVAFNCRPLADMFKAINERFDKLEQRCAFYEERSLQMLDALTENAQRLSVSENQYAAVFDTVSALQKDVNAAQRDKLDTATHEATTARLDEQLAAVRRHIEVVDSRKQEIDIPALMKRVTLESKDVSTKLLIERETEQRRYMENMLHEKVKLLDADVTKKTEHAMQSAESAAQTTRQTLLDTSNALTKKVEALDKSNATTSSILENFALKFLLTENCLDSLSDVVKEDVADARMMARCICHAFGVNGDAVLSAVPAHEKHALIAESASESNTLRGWKWDRLEGLRKQAFVDGWNAVRKSGGGDTSSPSSCSVTARIMVPTQCPQVPDVNTAMAKRDELVRTAAKTRKEQQAAENARTVGMEQTAKVAMSELGKMFVHSPVFVDIEARAVSAVRQDMTVLQQKVISDSTAQIQQLDRVVRSKISFDRAQQLVTEAAGVASEKSNEPVKESIEALRRQVLMRDQALSLLSEKVSHSDLLNQVAPAIEDATKAGRLALEMKMESDLMMQKVQVEKRIQNVRDRCGGNEVKVDDLSRALSKVQADVSAVQLRAAASISRSGQDTSGAGVDGEAADRCLSCGSEIQSSTTTTKTSSQDDKTRLSHLHPGKHHHHHHRGSSPSSAGKSPRTVSLSAPAHLQQTSKSGNVTPLALSLDPAGDGGGGGGGGGDEENTNHDNQNRQAKEVDELLKGGGAGVGAGGVRVLSSTVDDASERKGGGKTGGDKTSKSKSGVPHLESSSRPASASSEKENGQNQQQQQPRGPVPPPAGKQQGRPANWYQSMDDAFQLRALNAAQQQQQQQNRTTDTEDDNAITPSASLAQIHLQQLQQLSERTATQQAHSRPSSARNRPGGAWKNMSNK